MLGSGSNCNQLEQNTLEALKDLKLDISIELITDFTIIASYGVMSTPALIINDNVATYGKVCTKEEVKELIFKFK